MNQARANVLSFEVQLELPFDVDTSRREADIIPIRVEWTENDIFLLRCGILEQSLRFIEDGRVGSQCRNESLEWVASDDAGPFSFTVCCQAAGYRVDALRAALEAFSKRRKPIKRDKLTDMT